MSESPASEWASCRMRILVGALTALPLIGILPVGVSGIEEEAREGLAEVRADADFELFNLPSALVVAGADIATEESLGSDIPFDVFSSVGFICALDVLTKEA